MLWCVCFCCVGVARFVFSGFVVCDYWYVGRFGWCVWGFVWMVDVLTILRRGGFEPGVILFVACYGLVAVFVWCVFLGGFVLIVV